MDKAVELHQAGDVDAAVVLYERVLAERPESAEANHLLGLAAEQEGDHARAIDFISRAIAIDPDIALYHYNLGNVHAALTDHQAAAASYEEALRCDPTMWEAHHNLGVTQERLGDLTAARQAFETAVTLRPRSVDTQGRLARVLARQGDHAAAVEAFSAAAALAPERTDLLKGLALSLLKAGRLGEAMEAYERLQNATPEEAEAYIGLSCVLTAQGRHEEAKQATRTATRLAPIRRARARGSEQGQILVLYSTEGAQYEMTADGLAAQITNNVESHLDRDRWLVHVAYVHEAFLNDVVPRLPPYDLAFNLVTDPDNCPNSLAVAEAYCRQSAVPVLNRPEAILKATRDANYRRFRDLPGILWPRTVRHRFGDDPARDLAALIESRGFDFPVIVRQTGTHTGRTAVKIDSLDQIRAAAGSFVGASAYVIQFVENTLDGVYYRRLRCFVADGRLIARNIQYADHWNSHEGTGSSALLANSWMREQDRAFIEDPAGYLGETNYGTLERLTASVDLDYFGVDFTVLESGEILVFELNASMNFSDRGGEVLPYRLQSFERLRAALNAMVGTRLSS